VIVYRLLNDFTCGCFSKPEPIKSDAKIAFFVTLWYSLGQQGTFSITNSQSGLVLIGLTVENWAAALWDFFFLGGVSMPTTSTYGSDGENTQVPSN
jgi:hypothetical protein